MMSEWKAYLKYYIKSNRRLIILVLIILFLMMPFFTFNHISPIISKYSLFNKFTTLGAMTYICGCVLSYLVPIFNYRYLYKKSSHELYYSLPITRQKLFRYTFLSGLLVMYVPLIINYAIGQMILVLLPKYDENLYAMAPVIFLLGFCVLLLIQYTIFTFLSVKCNNLIDSIIVNGAYVIMPVVVLIAVYTFFNHQITAIIGEVGAFANEFLNIELLQQLLSLPMMIISYFVHCLTSFGTRSNAFQMYVHNFSWWLVLYWGIIGFVCYWFAQKAFIQRKVEDAQQRTTTLFAYPVIITVVTFSLVLFVMNVDGSVLLPSIIILAFYFCMIFFSNRKIHVRLLHVLVFGIIYCSTLALSFVFTQSSGFGFVREFPLTENMQNVKIQVTIPQYFEESIDYPIYEAEDKKREIEEFNMYGVGKDAAQEAMQIQETCSKQKENSQYDQAYYIRFTYTMKNKKIIYREYYIEENKENQAYLQGLLKRSDMLSVTYSVVDR